MSHHMWSFDKLFGAITCYMAARGCPPKISFFSNLKVSEAHGSGLMKIIR